MGQTGFCKNLRVSAFFCENLRFSAKICASRNAVIPSKRENQAKAAKICEKLRIQLRLSHFSLSLLIPLESNRLSLESNIQSLCDGQFANKWVFAIES